VIQLAKERNDLSDNVKKYLSGSLESRSDPAWNWLRHEQQVESKLNQFVRLPKFGKEFYGKDFQPEIAESFFMTLERIGLYKKLFRDLHFGEQNAISPSGGYGLILRGPHGIGKTVDEYFLVSAAYVNNSIVLYIVRFSFFS
jgi:hypothetical protein